jgi:hypothetical protein
MTPFQLALTLTAFILGNLLWSYALFGDNYGFAFAEAALLGGNAANSVIVLLLSLRSGTITPILAGNIVLLIGLILGLTAFTRLTRYRWAARYGTAILSGAGVGVLFGLNVRANILTGVTDTINGVANAILKPATGTLGNMAIPSWIMAASWISSAIVFVIMTLTFNYSQVISGPFFNPKSRLAWVSKLGRYFIMIMLGYISLETLLGDSTDTLLSFIQTVWVRTLVGISSGISPFFIANVQQFANAIARALIHL